VEHSGDVNKYKTNDVTVHEAQKTTYNYIKAFMEM